MTYKSPPQASALQGASIGGLLGGFSHRLDVVDGSGAVLSRWCRYDILVDSGLPARRTPGTPDRLPPGLDAEAPQVRPGERGGDRVSRADRTQMLRAQLANSGASDSARPYPPVRASTAERQRQRGRAGVQGPHVAGIATAPQAPVATAQLVDSKLLRIHPSPAPSRDCGLYRRPTGVVADASGEPIRPIGF